MHFFSASQIGRQEILRKLNWPACRLQPAISHPCNSVQEQITSPSQQRIAEEETRESSHDFGREIESTQSDGGGVEPMVTSTTETNTYRTRSGRIVKPPDRFGY